MLNKKGIDRIYNVFMKEEVYEATEDFFNQNFDELAKASSPREFLWKLGELVPGKSILKTCYKNKIPVFCPALTDSGIGLIRMDTISICRRITFDSITRGFFMENAERVPS